jgi:hypothetical protein
MSDIIKISVIYLAYIPFKESYLSNFVNSYKKYDSGITHELIILFNGHNDLVEVDPFITILNESNISYNIFYSPEKFDIASYFYISKLLKSKYVCFLNTYSEIQNNKWLLYYYNGIEKINIGCVSATAAWGDYSHDDEFKHLLNNISTITILKFKKLFIYYFNFYPKVKAHLRTNAFIINRKLFLSLNFEKVRPKLLNLIINISHNKIKSLCFEHGKNSLSNQLKKLNLNLLVVDRNGNLYEEQDWYNSCTFWSSKQENLLISDNQTKKYDLSHQKYNYTYAAWGKK